MLTSDADTPAIIQEVEAEERVGSNVSLRVTPEVPVPINGTVGVRVPVRGANSEFARPATHMGRRHHALQGKLLPSTNAAAITPEPVVLICTKLVVAATFDVVNISLAADDLFFPATPSASVANHPVSLVSTLALSPHASYSAPAAT